MASRKRGSVSGSAGGSAGGSAAAKAAGTRAAQKEAAAQYYREQITRLVDGSIESVLAPLVRVSDKLTELRRGFQTNTSPLVKETSALRQKLLADLAASGLPYLPIPDAEDGDKAVYVRLEARAVKGANLDADLLCKACAFETEDEFNAAAREVAAARARALQAWRARYLEGILKRHREEARAARRGGGGAAGGGRRFRSAQPCRRWLRRCAVSL